MGFYRLAEQELLLNISGTEPHQVSVYTTWPRYTTRVARCEGFTATVDFQPEEGGRCLEGVIDITDFNYLHLRKQFGSAKREREFAEQRAQLPAAPQIVLSEFRHEPNERETLFHAVAENPYWLTVQTDAAVWLRRMDEHPYAVLVEEQRYHDVAGDDQYTVMRKYMLPLHLLTIRRNRPQYTDEYREQLRQRLLASRPSR